MERIHGDQPKVENCKFCEALNGYKELYAGANRGLVDPELGPYMHEYTVALVIRSWFKTMGKRNAGRTTCYRYRGIGYELNFCPECGKMINKKKGETKEGRAS